MGRERCFMLRPLGEQSRVPFDLLGVQYLDYDARPADGNWRAVVGPAVTEMSDVIVALGRRSLGI
jgi:predicted nucleotide-binding protein